VLHSNKTVYQNREIETLSPPTNDNDPSAYANQRIGEQALYTDETVPGIPPPKDEEWLKEQQEAGINLPPPPRARPQALVKTASSMPKGKYSTLQRKAIEKLLSEEHWAKVYEAFAHTGVISEISNRTGVSKKHVEFLLEFGIPRLGLKPIRDHAVDLAEVNRRVADTGLDLHDHNLDENNWDMQAMDVQQAATSRVMREASAARRGLDTAIETNEIVYKYAVACLEALKKGKSTLVVPDKMTVSFIKKLGEAIGATQKAVATAVKTSKLAAGEPTDIMHVQVAGMLCAMSDEELMEAERTGKIPRRLAARFDEGPHVIEAHAEIIESNEEDK
jgi:hypothetical protein